MAEIINAQKPNGEQIKVSRKVFERILKERGYTLVKQTTAEKPVSKKGKRK